MRINQLLFKHFLRLLRLWVNGLLIGDWGFKPQHRQAYNVEPLSKDLNCICSSL